MRGAFTTALRVALLGLAATAASLQGCSAAPCTDLVHKACSLDGGKSCSTNQSCVLAGNAVDPCEAGAVACCFEVCHSGTCSDDTFQCVDSAGAKVCAQGRCIP